MKEIILMLHPTFGVLGVLAALWVFVEMLSIGTRNVQRVRYAALASSVFIWLSYLAGGYWYVVYYGADKAAIKAGPWPFAHSVVMETKEHVFFALLLLSTYLPIAAYGATAGALKDTGVQKIVLISAAFVVLLGLAMEGGGAVVALGAKLGLLRS